MKKIKLGLLPRVIIAIALGIALGNVLSLPVVRVFVTFNAVFSQFLNFVIPLIIIGLVTPAIADIGKGAGKLLLATVAIAYADTVLTGVLSYGVGTSLFPSMISSVSDFSSVVKPEGTAPYFEITIPPMADVMSALVFSFLMGLCISLQQHAHSEKCLHGAEGGNHQDHSRGGGSAVAALYLRHIP